MFSVISPFVTFSILASMVNFQILLPIQPTINMDQSHQYQCIYPIKSHTNLLNDQSLLSSVYMQNTTNTIFLLPNHHFNIIGSVTSFELLDALKLPFNNNNNEIDGGLNVTTLLNNELNNELNNGLNNGTNNVTF
eukprot:445545_1